MVNMNLFFISFLTGASGAWAAMKYGDKIGINDIPSSRSSHVKAVPKGGGVGILLVFILSGLLLPLPVYFWLPGSVLSLVSFWGDRYEIAPKIRLLSQFACTSVFLIGFFYWEQTASIGVLFILPLAVFITGTSNFFNFMDGIDGIAGMTGIVGFFLIWVFHTLKGGDDVYGVFCIAMALSCVGFLIFNVPKARVFMGDVGSILLGFVFGCLVVLISDAPLDFLMMPGFLFLFYFDEIITMAVRIRDRDSLFKPHRKHIYQLLANELGNDHWKVSLVYAFFQLLIGLTLILARSKGYYFLFMVYGFFSILFLYMALHIRKKVFHP